jgi:hypothetical protein
MAGGTSSNPSANALADEGTRSIVRRNNADILDSGTQYWPAQATRSGAGTRDAESAVN